MGLYAPCFAAATLTSLDTVGLAIIQEDAGWFIRSSQHTAGPYATPEAALEASMSWFAESDALRSIEIAAAQPDQR